MEAQGARVPRSRGEGGEVGPQHADEASCAGGQGAALGDRCWSTFCPQLCCCLRPAAQGPGPEGQDTPKRGTSQRCGRLSLFPGWRADCRLGAGPPSRGSWAHALTSQRFVWLWRPCVTELRLVSVPTVGQHSPTPRTPRPDARPYARVPVRATEPEAEDGPAGGAAMTRIRVLS